MENTTFGIPIVSVLFDILVVVLPILIIIVVARSIRRMVTPHDKEMQRLLGQVVTLLEENNRLLTGQNSGKRPE